MPKKQSTAAKKARALQREAGGKHTTLLAEQTCGRRLDPWEIYPGTCARPPHPDLQPCSPDRGFDIDAWKEREAACEEQARRRREAMTPQERAGADERARQMEYDYEDPLGDRDDYRFDA